MKRWLKYRYVKLLRVKGGPSIVALGFAIGLFVEMFTLPTYGAAFFLVFPLIYLFRANLAAALLGFVTGKIIYLPLMYLHLKVGGILVNKHVAKQLLRFLPHNVESYIMANLKLIVGGMVDGAILGVIAYFPIRYALELYTKRRKEKRKLRKAELAIRNQQG